MDSRRVAERKVELPLSEYDWDGEGEGKCELVSDRSSVGEPRERDSLKLPVCDKDKDISWVADSDEVALAECAATVTEPEADRVPPVRVMLSVADTDDELVSLIS